MERKSIQMYRNGVYCMYTYIGCCMYAQYRILLLFIHNIIKIGDNYLTGSGFI